MLIEKPLPIDGNMSWKVTTAPAIEPVSVDDFKLFARIDGTAEDHMIQDLSVSIRELTELWLGRALIEQSITLVMDWWPETKFLRLPRPPLISITSVVTVDEDDVETTYLNTKYYVDTVSEPGRLIIKQDTTAPENTDRDYAGFKIVYKAGYGTTTSSVPSMIRDGIKLWAAYAYENRIIPDTPPQEAAKLLKPYKLAWDRLL